MRASNQHFFPGYVEKQFILFFLCEDPWQYLSNLRIPDELIIISGLTGFKRKREDTECLLISDKFSGVSKIDRRFMVGCNYLKEITKVHEHVPIPFLKGEIKKDEIIIQRDRINYHPLYYSRLPDGFVLSTRREWIRQLGYKPIDIMNKNNIIVTKETLKLSRCDRRNYTGSEHTDSEVITKDFLNAIKKSYEAVHSQINEIYLVPSGSIGDLIIMKIIDEIKVFWPFKEIKVPVLFQKNVVLPSGETDYFLNRKVLKFVQNKAESNSDLILLLGLIINLLRSEIGVSGNLITINGIGLDFKRLDELIVFLHDLFKVAWPAITLPIILSGRNFDLIEGGQISVPRITNYLNIEEDIILEYQSTFSKIVEMIHGIKP